MATRSQNYTRPRETDYAFPAAGAGAGIALIVSLFVSPFALADAADTTVAPSTAARSSSGDLEEITVTATRRAESQSKVPVAVTAFDSESLAVRGITTETDLQQSVPGLTVKTTASQNQINYTIRGQTLDAFSGSSPGVLPYFNDVVVSSQTATAFYDLASVQVLKGPQGTLFGRNATGGAVLYTSAEASDKFGGYFTIKNGNYDLREYQGAVNLPIVPGKVDLRLAADFTNEAGYVTNLTDGSTLGDTAAKSGRATLKITLTDKLTTTTVIQYGWYGGTELPGGLYSYYPVGSTNNGHVLADTAALLYTPGGPFWSPALAALVPGGIAQELAQQQAEGPYKTSLPYTPLHRSEDSYAENTTTYDVDSDLTIKNIASVQHHGTRSDGALSGARLGVLDLAAYPTTVGVRYDIDQWSEELQLQGHALQESLKYIVGLYAAAEVDVTDIPTVVGISLPQPLQYFHHNWTDRDHTQAVYAQGTYDLSWITSGLSFTLGARETWEEIKLIEGPLSRFPGYPAQAMSEKDPSWQVGLQYQITPEFLTYVVTRGSWRAGNFNGTTTPVGNVNQYGPERTHDVELGAKYSGRIFDRSAQFNVAIYNQVVDGVQRDVYFTIGGAPSSLTLNVPQGRVNGVEVDGQIRALDWLTLGGAGAFAHATYPKGEVVVAGQPTEFSNYQDTPRWTGDAFTTVTLPTPSEWGGMSIRADAYYQTSQAFTSLLYSVAPGTLLPAYALINMRGDWTDVMGSKLTVSAYVKNLANRTNYVGGFGLGPDVGFNTAVAGAPRKYGAELTFKF
jgi:iron complex outermembrane recepter protein